MEITDMNESRRLLRRYLSQYYRAKEKQAALRKRLAELKADLNDPGVNSPPLDSAPVRQGRHSDGAATLTFKIGEIEDRIQRQIEVQTKSVIDIMDVLDFLPAESTERDILEYRHIDCKSWSEIMNLVHLTRSPCFEHYNKGLDKLLTFKKVRATLSAYEDRLAREARDSC